MVRPVQGRSSASSVPSFSPKQAHGGSSQAQHSCRCAASQCRLWHRRRQYRMALHRAQLMSLGSGLRGVVLPHHAHTLGRVGFSCDDARGGAAAGYACAAACAAALVAA